MRSAAWLPLRCTLLVVVVHYQLLALAGPEADDAPVKGRHVDVLILGAGIAGITAARKLVENNPSVTNFALLEGLDRIGGRLRNTKIANVTVELGANWVHGILGNPIWHMAEECKLSGRFSDFDNATIRWSSRDKSMYAEAAAYGSAVSEESGSGGFRPKTEHVIRDESSSTLPVAQCYVEHGGKTCAGDSGQDILQRWKALEESERRIRQRHKELDKSMDDYSLRAALRMEGWRPEDHADHAIEYFNYDFEYARPPQETSFAGSVLHTYEDFDTENFFVADQRGFSSILMNSCRAAFGGDCPLSHGSVPEQSGSEQGPWLIYSQNVTSVSSNCKDNGSVTWNNTDSRYCVRTDSGVVYSADHIIITFPLGVLQNDGVQFVPPLPDWKVTALHRMEIGLFSKVFIAFPRRFWDSSQFLIYVSSNRGFMVPWINLEQAGQSQRGDDGVAEQNDSPHILAVILTGKEASRTEEQPLEVTQAEVMDCLRDMFPNESVPEPIDIVKTDWDRHPFFRGSYSNRPVGLTDNDLYNIRLPVGRLYFAGEAMSERYNGFLQGGLETGESAARAVLEAMGLLGQHCSHHSPRPHIKIETLEDEEEEDEVTARDIKINTECKPGKNLWEDHRKGAIKKKANEGKNTAGNAHTPAGFHERRCQECCRMNCECSQP